MTVTIRNGLYIKEKLLAGFGFADEHPANPVAQIFKQTENDSPSAWGEGWVYISTNSGSTWVQQTNPLITNCVNIASSADGSKLVATD
jgi:hypothetical protein